MHVKTGLLRLEKIFQTTESSHHLALARSLLKHAPKHDICMFSYLQIPLKDCSAYSTKEDLLNSLHGSNGKKE